MKQVLMWAAVIGLFVVNGAVAQETKAKSPAPAAAPVDRDADTAAIQDAMSSFTKKFNERDVKGLAGQFTKEAEHETTSGLVIRGRDAIEAAFEEFFSVNTSASATFEEQATRFLSRDTAMLTGLVSIQKGATAVPVRAEFRALFVREGKTWRIASLSETDAPGVNIADLEWLIGEWKSATAAGAAIKTTYRWDAQRKFIHVTFAIQDGDLDLAGTQVLGIDPASNSLHSWTFEAMGGIGEGDWTPDGNNWVIDAVATLPNGATLRQTNILSRVDQNTFTWQSIHRTLDGAALPDLPPARIERVIAEK